MIEELAIKFSGININRSISQPPITDKYGRSYDLDDPAFPVVKDHDFKTKYWAMPKTATFMLKYLEEHWVYFNKTRFGGRMKPPAELGLLRDVDAMKMKTRGMWWPYERKLKISPNLFNAPHEGWVNRTLIHEMCHQHVSDLEGGERSQKGHGPKWQHRMMEAGLPPNRFDFTSNITYMDQFERRKHKTAVNFHDASNFLKETRNRILIPAAYTPCVFPSAKGETFGMIVMEQPDLHDWWIVATSIARPDGTSEFHERVPGRRLYALEPEEAEKYGTKEWKAAVDLIRVHIAKKLAEKK